MTVGPFTKPPFFQWPVDPVAARGLGDLAAGCTPGGVHFDGATELVNLALTASAGDTTTLISFWLRQVRTPGAFSIPWISNPDTTGTTRPNFQCLSLGTQTPAQILQQWNPLNQYREIGPQWPTDEAENGNHVGGNDDQWMHILCQINSSGTPKPGTVLVNGLEYGDYPYELTAGADTINGLAGLPFWIGGCGIPGSEQFYTGDMAELWVGSGVDALEADGTFSDATIAKFIGPGNVPADLGTDGSTPFGVAPAIYCHVCDGDAADDFLLNRGTGGDFAYDVGALTAATFPPGGEPKPVGQFAISGSPFVGAALAIAGTWTNAPTSVAYEWWSSNTGTVIATTPGYVVQAGDLGDFLWAVILATNAAGSTFVDTSVTGQNNTTYFGPITAAPVSGLRITGDGDVRATSDGDSRIVV